MSGALDGFTFVTVIGDRLVRGSWQAWLAAELAGAGVALAGNDLVAGGQTFGFFRMLEVGELAESERDASWLAPRRCPWTGAPAGVFAWTHNISQDPARNRMIPALMSRGRGPFARLWGEDREVLESMALQRVRLATLLERHSQEDLLLRDDDYLADARRVAEAALATAGFEALVGTWPDDNPLRIAGELQRNGCTVEDPQRALVGHTMELWTLDMGILQHPTFWFD
jgi:hypothetical protein